MKDKTEKQRGSQRQTTGQVSKCAVGYKMSSLVLAGETQQLRNSLKTCRRWPRDNIDVKG